MGNSLSRSMADLGDVSFPHIYHLEGSLEEIADFYRIVHAEGRARTRDSDAPSENKVLEVEHAPREGTNHAIL